MICKTLWIKRLTRCVSLWPHHERGDCGEGNRLTNPKRRRRLISLMRRINTKIEPMETRRWPLAAAALVLLAVSGCSGGGTAEPDETETPSAGAVEEVEEVEVEQLSECEAKVAALAEANGDPEYQAANTFEADDAALMACEDLAAFEAAVEQNPEAVEGDPATLVTNRCEYSEVLGGASICEDV